MIDRFCPRARHAVLACLALALALPAHADAQRRGRTQPVPDVPWASVAAGITLGYDDNANGQVVGSHLRIPVLRNGRIELIPNANVTFLPGLREYQYNVDAAYVSGGRRGGLYGGGGLGWRNSVFGSAGSGRETVRSFNAFLGVKSASTASVGVQLELRWAFLEDTDFNPRMITFGINLPLTNRGRGPLPRS